MFASREPHAVFCWRAAVAECWAAVAVAVAVAEAVAVQLEGADLRCHRKKILGRLQEVFRTSFHGKDVIDKFACLL